MMASVSPPSSTRAMTCCWPSCSRMMPKVSRSDCRTDAGMAGAVMWGTSARGVPGAPNTVAADPTLTRERFCTFQLCAIQLRHVENAAPAEAQRRDAEARPPAVLRAVLVVAGHDQAVQAAARPARPHLPAIPGHAGAVGRRRHRRLRAGPAAAA